MKTTIALFQKLLIIASLSCMTLTSHSAGHGEKWNLSKNESKINFVSIKKGNIGEVHSFTQFSGSIDHNQANISIDTTSVDMLIPIRNERALQYLFEADTFPTIDIKSDIKTAINDSKKGTTMIKDIQASLSLHGITKDITINVSITRNGKNSLTVSSAKPVIINAADFNMEAGIAKLGELAGKIPVVTSVPVNFIMTFKKAT